MSLISFMKEAGEKLFGKKVQETYAAPAKAAEAPKISARIGVGACPGSRTISTRSG